MARDAAAVGEVVGDAGVLLGPDDGAGTVAQLLRIVTSDAELRDELAARGEQRVRLYDQAATAGTMRAILEEMAGS